MITVHLPRDLAAEFLSPPVLAVEDVENLAALWAALERRHPGLGRWLREPDGAMRQHLSLFVDARRVPWAEAPLPLADGQEVWILRAVSGG